MGSRWKYMVGVSVYLYTCVYAACVSLCVHVCVCTVHVHCAYVYRFISMILALYIYIYILCVYVCCVCVCVCVCVSVCECITPCHYHPTYVCTLNRASPSQRAHSSNDWLHNSQQLLATGWGCLQTTNHTSPPDQQLRQRTSRLQTDRTKQFWVPHIQSYTWHTVHSRCIHYHKGWEKKYDSC